MSYFDSLNIDIILPKISFVINEKSLIKLPLLGNDLVANHKNTKTNQPKKISDKKLFKTPVLKMDVKSISNTISRATRTPRIDSPAINPDQSIRPGFSTSLAASIAFFDGLSLNSPSTLRCALLNVRSRTTLHLA